MRIQCVGLNHRSAPLELRERMAFSAARARATLARCGCGDREPTGSFSELVVLSTCNRTELYAAASEPVTEALIELLAESSGVPRPEFEAHLYRLDHPQSAAHLFRVAVGLDSQILGEPQVLGQVGEAYMLALGVGSAGLLLSRAFRAAIHAGKRARHETAIAVKPATISSVAVHHIASLAPDLQQLAVLVVGAGEMAELSVEALRKRGVQRITVINRTVARAEALARRWSATARPFEALQSTLAEADVVICSTGAPHVVIHREQVAEAMQGRPDRPMILMDIAVPRDVEDSVDTLDQVYRYDLERLEQQLSQSIEGRQAEVPRVEAIVAEELEAFNAWYEELSVLPVIKALRQQAEQLRRRELTRTLRRLPDLPPEAQHELDTLTRALVKKLLHEPTMFLKAQSKNGRAGEYALIARRLFGIGSADGATAEERE